jgi:hypothetical protein
MFRRQGGYEQDCKNLRSTLAGTTIDTERLAVVIWKPCTERSRLGLAEFASVRYVVSKGRAAVAKVLVLSIRKILHQASTSIKAVFVSTLSSFDSALWSLKAFRADTILVIFVGRDKHVTLQ